MRFLDLSLSRTRRASSIPLLAVLFVAGGGGWAFSGTQADGKTLTAASARPSSPQGAAGIFHVLRPGQTLFSLSRAYGVPLQTLASVNGIKDPNRIPAGSSLFVPGARRALDLRSPSLPQMAWPIVGEVTSAFETPGVRPGHEGIDIDGVMGEEVGAAAAGKVLWTGNERGYGEMVILDHGGGLSTAYAHASEILVEVGETVNAGEPVALVGDSGNARGAHLHFEVRRNGLPVDPLPFLAKDLVPVRR